MYFCDTHTPWRRGIRENTNGPLRQYTAKGTDMSLLGDEELDGIADGMNKLAHATGGFTKSGIVASTARVNSITRLRCTCALKLPDRFFSGDPHGVASQEPARF